MIIRKLKLENWKGINNKLIIEFDKGLNLIYGKNEIGKSTLIDAIKMAFIGDTSSKGSKYNELIPWGTDVKARVDLLFNTKDGNNYLIKKSFPKGITDLFLNDIKLCDTQKKTQEELFKILDISNKATNLFKLLFIDQGHTLDVFSKNNNPLDDNTKSYIGNVIKETAFKELKDFEDILKEELCKIYTHKGKLIKGEKASKYRKLLNNEEKLKTELEEIKIEENNFKEKIREIENLEKEIVKLINKKDNDEKYLKALNLKKKKLDELNNKKKDFNFIKKNYQNLLKVDEDLEKLSKELPKLFSLRDYSINQLNMEIEKLENKKKEMENYIGKLKKKKKKFDLINEKKENFNNLKKDYDQVEKIKNNILENDLKLPELFTLNRVLLKKELKEIESKIEIYLKKQKELNNLQEKLKTITSVTEKDIKKINKINIQVIKLKNKLESFKSRLKLNFMITPLNEKEISFLLKKDEDEFKSLTVKEQTEFINFRKLSFQYNNEFNIDINGDLTEVNFESLKEKYITKKSELKNNLDNFKVKTIEEIEKKYHEYEKLIADIDKLEELTNSMGNIRRLKEKKIEIKTSLSELKKELSIYMEIHGDTDKIEISDKLLNLTSIQVRDELIKAKNNKDNLKKQIKDILKNREFKILEKEYFEAEREIVKLQKIFASLEPIDLKDITQEMLDKNNDKLIEIKKNIADKTDDRKILESIDLQDEFDKKFDLNEKKLDKTSQQIRDEINQKISKNRELKKQKKVILEEKSVDKFKNDYLMMKDEIENLVENIKKIEPTKFKNSEEVEIKIDSLEKEIKQIEKSKSDKTNHKSMLTGEVKNYIGLIEEKNRVEFDYKQLLKNIHKEISDIASLKLLLNLIEVEKEKAQKEIFKPLEERMILSLNKLIPDKYKINIDNDLNFNVSAKTITGDIKNGINQYLSQGTKEQVSFLLRLSIAEQISKKEQQVMVLDDSFVNTDLNRLSAIIEIIKERADNIQFLIFTCKQDEYSHYNNNFNCINLEKLIK